jgi:hypothetical protein
VTSFVAAAYKRPMRIIALIIPSFWLLAAAAPPPPALAPYIHDSRFDPGDYGWMRGRFDDASPADKASSEAISAWIDGCVAEGAAKVRAELRAMGVADPKLDHPASGDPLCAEVAAVPSPISTRSFAAFQREAAAARPVAETYLLAVRIAEEIGGPRGPGLADKLLARPLGEQMVRTAMAWGEGEMKDAPPLSPDAGAIVKSRLWGAAAELDQRNTEWLKAIVDKQGWPTVSQVGAAASAQAWLLVQHADADPPFQLKVLRLMEPLARGGEVSKRNYAYLYDRVMLKLNGRQRYATQMTCRGGRRAPLPLEDEAAVGRERAAMELDPLAAYLAQMQEMYGDCPPDR